MSSSSLIETWQIRLPRELGRIDHKYNVIWNESGLVIFLSKYCVVVFKTDGPNTIGEFPKSMLSEPGFYFQPKYANINRPMSDSKNITFIDMPRKGKFRDELSVGKAANTELAISIVEISWDINEGIVLLENGDLLLISLPSYTLDATNELDDIPVSCQLQNHRPLGTILPNCVSFLGNQIVIGGRIDGMLCVFELIRTPQSRKLDAKLQYAHTTESVWVTQVAWRNQDIFWAGYSNGTIKRFTRASSSGEWNSEEMNFSDSTLPVESIKFHHGSAALVCIGNTIFWWQSLENMNTYIQRAIPCLSIVGIDWMDANTIVAATCDGQIWFLEWSQDTQGRIVNERYTENVKYPFSDSNAPIPFHGLALSPNRSILIGASSSRNSIYANANVRVNGTFPYIAAISMRRSLDDLLIAITSRYVSSGEILLGDVIFQLLRRGRLMDEFSRKVKESFDPTDQSPMTDVIASICISIIAQNRNMDLVSGAVETFLENVNKDRIAQWQIFRLVSWLILAIERNFDNNSPSHELKSVLLSWCDLACQIGQATKQTKRTSHIVQKVYAKLDSRRQADTYPERAPDLPAVCFDDTTLGLRHGLFKRDMFSLHLLKSIEYPVLMCPSCGSQTNETPDQLFVFPKGYSRYRCVLCAIPLTPLNMSSISNFVGGSNFQHLQGQSIMNV